MTLGNARISAGILPRLPADLTTPPDPERITFDSAAERVWVGGRELQLTPREFAVLCYLARRVGRVVSSSELLQAVWGTDDVIGDEALRTTIKRLRRKLGDNPRRPRYIANVWGRGYCLQG